MGNSISFNPIVTTNGGGSFTTTFDGFVQGTALDSPAVRYQLSGGILAAAETLPMWGGVAISEIIGGAGVKPPSMSLGGPVSRATSVAAPTSGQQAAGAITGFSVFDQAYNMVNTPQSPVPLASAGMSVNFYRLGSLARIAVAMDPVLVDLEGYLIKSLVSWDFAEQRLVPYVAAYPANVFTGLTRAASGPGGTYVATATTTSAHGVTVGSDITVSGCTPDAYNGTFTAIAGTTGSTLVYNIGTTTDPGAISVEGQLNAGGGALPCSILDINVGNSMVVAYDPVTGFATWNRSGSCAIIQI